MYPPSDISLFTASRPNSARSRSSKLTLTLAVPSPIACFIESQSKLFRDRQSDDGADRSVLLARMRQDGVGEGRILPVDRGESQLHGFCLTKSDSFWRY